MADKVIDFLRYRVFPGDLQHLGASVKAPFLPGLVLAAHDDPQHLPCLLASIEDQKDVTRALAYASLDYGEIRRNVEGQETPAEDGAVLQEMDEEQDENAWYWREEQNENADECLRFEKANEDERVQLALISLRKRSTEVSVGDETKVAVRHGNDMGSIWNNAAYVSELLLLLPIATTRCPTLLTPEHLVQGLLTAGCGVMLLVATLANNPYLVERAALLLVEFVKAELDHNPEAFASNKSTSAGLPSTSRRRDIPKTKPEFETAVWTLFKLCQLAPSFALTCRRVLVDSLVLVEMALLLTVEMIHDELDFLSGVLFKSRRSSQWLLTFMSSNQKSHMPLPHLGEGEGSLKSAGKTGEKEWLAHQLRKALLKDARQILLEKGWCAQLRAHIKAYCILIRSGDMQPTHEEVDFWLKALAHDKIKSPAGTPPQRTLELGVVFLCLVPGLSAIPTRTLYHGCVSYLLLPAKSTASTSTVELAIWLSVQLLLRNFSNIAEFVRESLGIHVTVHNAPMRDLAESAISAGITSEPSMLANAVAALRPQGALADNVKQQSRTLICLEQLLQAGTFTRCAVDILGAVMYSISRAREPVSTKLVQFIQAFVESPLQQANGKGVWKLARLRDFLLEAVSPAISLFAYHKHSQLKASKRRSTNSTLAPAALATYYILCREHLLRSLVTGPEEEQWWLDLIACIPWRLFLAHMEKSWSNYENLLPQWLGLATVLFPEKFFVPKLLDLMENADIASGSLAASVPVVEDLEWVGPFATDVISSPQELLSLETIQLTCRKAVSEPLLALRLLQVMCERASSYTWDLKEVVGNSAYWNLECNLIRELLPVLLEPKCPRRIQDYFCKWWYSLPAAAMEHLIIVFFETVRVSSAYSGLLEDIPLSYSSLVRDPLLFLSSTPRLFRTPLLSIFLDTLMEILVVNRRVCESAASDSGKDGALRREEVAAALAVQDSAVCQILLERCLLNKSLGDNEDTPLSEAQRLICATLSSLFHTNTLLFKLVHFQGYDARLVPVMVEHVPVMVQCLDFLEELLQQQQEQKQVFAVLLASHVISQYPEATRSLPVAEKVLSHVIYIQTNVAGSSEILQKVVQAVSEIAVTFPELASKVVTLLQSCAEAGASLARSGPPRDPKLEAAATAAFKNFVRRRILHGHIPFTQDIPEI